MRRYGYYTENTWVLQDIKRYLFRLKYTAVWKACGVLNNTQIIIGKRIRHFRKIRDITQKELAAELGVAPKYIACIEQGIKSPSLEKMVDICKWFGVSMADILPIEVQSNIEIKETWINEIVDACRDMEASQVGLLKTMICSLNG